MIKPPLAVSVVCILLALALSGCGGGGSAPNDTTTGTSSSASSSASSSVSSNSSSSSTTSSSSSSSAVARYQITGTIVGLTSAGLVINNNAADALTVSASASAFTFGTLASSGTTYAVNIVTQPLSQFCAVANGTGVVGNTNITGVRIVCVARKSIVFTRTAGAQIGLYLIKEDGTGLTHLAQGTAEITLNGISSDGRIIFSRAGGTIGDPFDLWSVRLDGTGETLLASGATYFGTTVNGRVIFHTSYFSADATARIPADVYSIKADGSGLISIAVGGGEQHASLITDTGKIIYCSTVGGQTDIYGVNDDGSGLVLLDHAPGPAEARAITGTNDVILLHFETSAKIYSTKLDGSGGLIPLAANSDNEYFNSLTPGGRVVFERDTNSSIDLYSIKPDGTGLAALANSAAPEIFNQVTPSGRVIYVNTGASRYDLYSVNEDGTDQKLILPSTESLRAVAVTSSNQVVIQRQSAPTANVTANWDLYAVSADGSTPLFTIANTPEDEIYLDQSPSGRWLFSSSPAGQYARNLFSENQYGSVQRLTSGTTDKFYCGVTTNNAVVYTQSTGSGEDIFAIGDDGTGFNAIANSTDDENCLGVF